MGVLPERTSALKRQLFTSFVIYANLTHIPARNRQSGPGLRREAVSSQTYPEQPRERPVDAAATCGAVVSSPSLAPPRCQIRLETG